MKTNQRIEAFLLIPGCANPIITFHASAYMAAAAVLAGHIKIRSIDGQEAPSFLQSQDGWAKAIMEEA